MDWPWPYINDGHLYIPDLGGPRSFIGIPLWHAGIVLTILVAGFVVSLLIMSSKRREDNT